MYVNDRDQISYHCFLKAVREAHGVPQSHVSKGICTVSGMNRFERGNRVAEKLMRDRLTARLGISGETYEDYLLPKEYELWQHRMRIIKAIESRDLANAKRELAEYEQNDDLNNLNMQFVEAMKYNILMQAGATNKELLKCVNAAIKHTVPSIDRALEMEHLLADQEMNLIAEKMRLSAPPKTVSDANAWRIKEYEKLISYMDQSRWEKLQKAKVYPKVAYYIAQCLMAKECDAIELNRGLELCENAIELLRDTSRLYYFVELTEMRRTLAERILEKAQLKENERAKLQAMLEENNTWERVLKELYEEYDVPTYMSNFCYLYYETECYNVVEVEEIRRTMLGISRVKICDGVCADRTLVRIEREGVTPTREVMRGLFGKMGLCAEYRRARIITKNAEALELYLMKLIKEINNQDIENGIESIRSLEETIDMRISHNKQELKRIETYLLYNGNKLSAEEFVERIIEALEYSLPMHAIENKKKKYISNVEMVCLVDLALNCTDTIGKSCMDLIKSICYDALQNGIDVQKISMLEFLMGSVACRLGDEGEFLNSCEMSEAIIKECLKHYRLEVVANNIYNKIWNFEQMNKIDVQTRIKYYLKCMICSRILKKDNVEAFFQNKIETLRTI